MSDGSGALPIAIVTGASSGIGEEFARQISNLGTYQLLLVARRRERLAALKAALEARSPSLRVDYVVADLTTPESRRSLQEAVVRGGAPVRLLVNNAGYGDYGDFASRDAENQRRMIRLNCEAAVGLVSEYLPRMLAQGCGIIINLCSITSFFPAPAMSTYAATKAFLYSFSQAVAAEVSGSGVVVQALCPGATESEFHLAAGLPRKIRITPAMTAADVVAASLARLERSCVVIPGFRNQLFVLVAKVLPSSISSRVVRFVLRKYR